jgi:two-component system sensor histidine kinase RegB
MKSAEQSLPDNSLRYLIWYSIAVVLVMLVSTVILSGQGYALASTAVWGAILGQVILSLAMLFAHFRRLTTAAMGHFVVVLMSVLLLGWYLYATGGHTNPVISILLVPLALSAALFDWRPTVLMGVCVVLMYTFLTQYFVPLSLSESGGHHGHDQHFMQLHLIGMWLTFTMSVLLIAGLVLPLALSVRRQQALISQQREKILQDEKLVALATFAASAAHKLGTPLSTLSILVEDFKELVVDKPEWQQDREVMAQQIDLCKTTLQDMMRRADSLRHNIREPLLVGDLIQHLKEQFNLLHPQMALQVSNHVDAALAVLADATLEQAALNLLDNAARVSDSPPQLSVQQDGTHLLLQIKDSGPGIPARIQQDLGQPFVTTRKDGLGLGLFLSHATIDRLGGELRLLPGKQGTTIEVRLPLREPDDE